MYWGKSNAVDSSSGSTVFAATNNFTGVWHLAEESAGRGSSGSGTYKDAMGVSNGDDSITNTNKDAMIGMGHAFTTGATMTTGDYIAMRAGVMSFTANAYTVSCWVKLPNAATAGGAIMSKIASSWASGATCIYFGDGTTNGNVSGLHPQIVSYSNNYLITSATLDVNAWHYLTFTHGTAASTGAIYIDGVAQTITNNTLSNGAADNTSQYVKIGDGNGGEMQSTFNGSMDEFVLANTQRSADWIKLCYETQRPNNSTVLVYEDYSTWSYSKRSVFQHKGQRRECCKYRG